MHWKTKRRCTYATIFFYNLCNGIDYAIIFPTIYNYVHERLKGTHVMFGFIIAAYSISSFIANPITGYFGDKTGNIRGILLLAIAFECLGSIMYFIGYRDWFLGCSRLVAGLGGGALSVVVADISHSTSEENRTAVLALVVASYQVGLLVGPGLNMFLKDLDFTLGSLSVDCYTSPGLFMAILWVAEAIAVLFFYFKLSSLKNEEDMDNLFAGYGRQNSLPQEPYQSDFEESTERLLVSSYPNYSSTTETDISFQPCLSSSVPNFQAEAFKHFEETSNVTKDTIKTVTCNNASVPASGDIRVYNNLPVVRVRAASESSSVTDNMIESAERFIQSASESFRDDETIAMNDQNSSQDTGKVPYLSQTSEGTASDPNVPSSEDNVTFFGKINYNFLRDEIVVLLALNFIAAFSQTLLETVVTPLTKRYYGFGEVENSIFYFCAAVEAVLMYVVIRYASRKFSDRVMILSGNIALCLALLLLLIFQGGAKENDMSSFPCFVVVVILDIMGLAVITVCASSLLSKIVSADVQGLAQGFRRSMISLGCILGPLWGGSYLNNMYALFSVPFSVSLLVGVLYLCSFKRLK